MSAFRKTKKYSKLKKQSVSTINEDGDEEIIFKRSWIPGEAGKNKEDED